MNLHHMRVTQSVPILRDRRACATPSVTPQPKPGPAVPVVLNSEARGLTNRANANAKDFAAPSLKGYDWVGAGLDKLAAQGEFGSGATG
jgi:hypothetical protein